MTARLTTRLLELRLFETVTTFIMLGMALTIVIAPATIEKGAFRYMLTFGFTPLLLVVFFAIVGAVRVAALYGNGSWPLWGPRLRALGAAGGAFVWCWMAWALVALMVNETGTPSIGIFNWIGLAIGEVISMARAGADVRRERHH